MLLSERTHDSSIEAWGLLEVLRIVGGLWLGSPEPLQRKHEVGLGGKLGR